MDTLKDIIKYFYAHYPFRNELSKARVVKMVYLADWKSAIIQQKQLTQIDWFFNHYGPYVSEIIEEISNDEDFEIKTVSNYFGGDKDLVVLNAKFKNPIVSPATKDILDFVIQKTSNLYWSDFINLIYSTYPIVNSPRYTHLNLVALAKEYTKK